MAKTKLTMSPEHRIKFYIIGRKMALALIAAGTVTLNGKEWHDGLTMKPIERRENLEPDNHPLQCGQASIYEAAGVFGVKHFQAGGLTRTETQPARIPKFKGARVSH